jgi:stress response protein YsnF
VTDTQQVSETVQREEARVEHDGDVNVRNDERR